MTEKKTKGAERLRPVYLIAWEEEQEKLFREWDYRISYLPPVCGGKEIFVRTCSERGRRM